MTSFYIPIRNIGQDTDNAIFAWLAENDMSSRIEWSGFSAEYLTFDNQEDAIAFTLMFGNVCTLTERII